MIDSSIFVINNYTNHQFILGGLMQKIIHSFLCISLLSLTLSADIITLRADVWEPFVGTPGSSSQGYMIEIAQKVFTEAGHTVDFQEMPWNRAIGAAKAGQINAIVGAFKSDAPDFIFPDNELGISKTAFFVLNDGNWKYDGVSSLKDVKLGIISGYSYGDEVDAYIKKGENVDVSFGDNALDVGIKKLIGKRIDTFAEDESVMLAYLKKTGQSDKLKSVGYLPSENVYIAFSPVNPKSKEYAKILSDGIAKLRASGELAKIMAKYGLKDWK